MGINTTKSFEVNHSDTNSGVYKLVHGISHDMSAPLRAVVQLTQMLKKRVGDKLDEKETYWLQLIEDSGCHAQKMIEALLVYSRLGNNNEPESEFLLKESIEKIIHEQNDQIQKISAEVRIEGDWPLISGNEARWQQYFSHIVSNALLYQPKQADHKPVVIIRGTPTNTGFTITVEDNGIGVTENLWPVLTTPFKRMQSDTDYPGIGMGLTYCDRIAELNGTDLTFGLSALGGLAVTSRISLC